MTGEEVFRSGTLEMSGVPLDGLARTPVWTDLTVNRVLCVIAVVLLVTILALVFPPIVTGLPNLIYG
jgi:hypothetical protein